MQKRIGADEHLTAECRLKAIKALDTPRQIEQTNGFLRGKLECSCSTQVEIAHHLMELFLTEKANSLLNDILDKLPHSVWEIEQLFELSKTLKRDDAVSTKGVVTMNSV